MESNIPVAGSDEPTPEAIQSAEPIVEVKPEAVESASTSQPTGETPAQDQMPEVVSAAPEAQPVVDRPENEMQTLLDQQPSDAQVKKGDILEGTVARTSP